MTTDSEKDLQALIRLDKTIDSRRFTEANSSYVASLLQAPSEKSLKKVAEESAEFIMAATALSTAQEHSEAFEKGSAEEIKHQKHLAVLREKMIAEAADLQFHMQVVLAHYNASLFEVASVLSQREGTSGHVEKAQRKVQDQ